MTLRHPLSLRYQKKESFMAYTVNQLAKASSVSIRTLRFYDQIGLLKPAYHGDNGYRYYEEEQLLMLQQILFFRELGFELKKIQEILERSDFDKISALHSHKKVLKKEAERMHSLIETIEKTIKHLKGEKSMKEQEMYFGFSKEKQAEYEKEIIQRFGKQGKIHIEESRQNVKNWKRSNWDASKDEFSSICNELTTMLKKHCREDSKEVQEIIHRHYEWLKQFWTPNKESYAGHADFIVQSDLRKAYEEHHKKLPEFIANAIKVYAMNSL